MHPATTIEAKRATDFEKAPDGGCNLPCQVELVCGHICSRYCHPYDPGHTMFECMQCEGASNMDINENSDDDREQRFNRFDSQRPPQANPVAVAIPTAPMDGPSTSGSQRPQKENPKRKGELPLVAITGTKRAMHYKQKMNDDILWCSRTGNMQYVDYIEENNCELYFVRRLVAAHKSIFEERKANVLEELEVQQALEGYSGDARERWFNEHNSACPWYTFASRRRPT